MFKMNSSAELFDAFRPLDRAEVEAQDLPERLSFPLLVKDYIAWSEPSGHRVFLVFAEKGQRQPLGIMFKRDTSGGAPIPRMCEWCHSVGGGAGVGLLTVSVSANRRIGIQLCRDLSCRQKAEGLPGADDFPQNLTTRERVWKITQRMSEFARRNLF